MGKGRTANPCVTIGMAPWSSSAYEVSSTADPSSTAVIDAKSAISGGGPAWPSCWLAKSRRLDL